MPLRSKMSALSAFASANSQQRKSSHQLNPNWQILVTLCHKLKSLPDKSHTDCLHERTELYLTHIHLNIYIINSDLSHSHGTGSLFSKECHLSTLSDWLFKVCSHQELFWQFFLFPFWKNCRENYHHKPVSNYLTQKRTKFANLHTFHIVCLL